MATPTSGKASGGSARPLWLVGLGALAAVGLAGFLTLRAPPPQAPQAAEPASALQPVIAPVASGAAPAQAGSGSVAQEPAQAVAQAGSLEAATPEVAATTAMADSGAAPAQPAPAPAPESAPESAPAPEPSVAPQQAPAPQAVPEAAPEAQTQPAPAPEPAPEPEPNPAPVAPRLDLVRVDAEGRAVIAGTAAPLARVSLRLDGTEIHNVTADRSGNFVAMIRIAPSDRPRVLSLEAAGDDGTPVAGAETAMIAPFAGPAPLVAETAPPPAEAPAAPSPAATASVQLAPAETGPADTGTVSPVETAALPQDQPAEAPSIVVAGDNGLRVVQQADPLDEGRAAAQLDAISYDAEGTVTLAGRGPAAAALRVTVGNQVIDGGGTDASGQWSLDLSDVAPGTYALRVEHLDAAGQVIAALETPFLREDPARIRDNPMLVEPGSSVITVQRGFTLWGIAEANFGSGFLYVQIFQENRGAIRDPDLIYPGQIFALPDLPRAGGVP